MPNPLNAPMMVGGAPAVPSMMGGANPLQMMGGIADLQNKLNENRKFQTEFMANQALGEIIAHSPSLEEGMQTAGQNPLIMGYATQGMMNLKTIQMLGLQAQQTQATTHEIQQRVGLSGRDAVLQAGVAALQHPENAAEIYESALQGLSPEGKAAAEPMVKAALHGMQTAIGKFDPNDPQQLAAARGRAAAVLGGYAAGAQINPGELEVMAQKPITTPEGLAGTQAGPFGGTMGQAPGQIQIQSGQAPQSPLQAGGGQMPQGATPNPISGGAYDTTPKVPFLTGPGGQPLRKPDGEPVVPEKIALQEQDLEKKSSTEYEAALGMNASLAQLTNAAMRLNAEKGWNNTGWGAKLRGELANLTETFNRVTGRPVPPEIAAGLADTTASMATIEKFSRQLAYQMENSFQGDGRHAFGLFQQTLSAVPGVENTPYAFMELAAGLKGMANYAIAKKQFMNDYSTKSYGHLFGADVSFNQQSPPIEFVRKELLNSLETSMKAGYLGQDKEGKLPKEAIDKARKIHESIVGM